MIRLLFSLLLYLLLPTLMCEAERGDFAENSNEHIPSDLLNLQRNQHPDTIKLHYGFSNLTFNNGPLQEVKLDHSLQQKKGDSLSLVKIAEAANELLPEDFEKICNTINDSSRMSDLKAVLSDNYFKLLNTKVQEGVSPYVVLANIQAIRPQNIHVLDSSIDKDQASLAVTGRSYFGPMRGLIRLVKIEGVWKIESEEWYTVTQNRKTRITTAFNPIPSDHKYIPLRPIGLMPEISPEYKTTKNFLPLTQASYTRDKRTFNFIFLMSKNKVNRQPSQDLIPDGQTALKDHRTRMHIMWTGSKKMGVEQQLIEHKYPIDVSIANYEDGYAQDQWNLILPSKKPRVVMFSALWSF